MVNFSYKYPILTEFSDCQVGTQYSTTWTLYNAYNPAGSAYTFVAYNYTNNETDVDSSTISNIVNNVSTYHIVDLNRQYKLRFYSESRQAQIKLYLKEYGNADLRLEFNGNSNTQTISTITSTWAIYQIYTQYLIEGWNEVVFKMDSSSGNEIWIRNATTNTELVWQEFSIMQGEYVNRTYPIAIDIWMADLLFYEEKNITIAGGNSNTWNIYFFPTEYELPMNRITMVLQNENGRYLDNFTFMIRAERYQYEYYIMNTIYIKAIENDSFGLIFESDETTTIDSVGVSVAWIETQSDYSGGVIPLNTNISIFFLTQSPYQEAEQVSYSVTIDISTDTQNNSYIFTIVARMIPALSTDLDNLSYTIDAGELSMVVFTLENTGLWGETYDIKVYRKEEYSHTATYEVSQSFVTLDAGGEITLNFTYESNIWGTDCIIIEITDSNGTIVHVAQVEYTIESVSVEGYNQILSYIAFGAMIIGGIAGFIYVRKNEDVQDEIMDNKVKYLVIASLLIASFLILLSVSGIIKLKVPIWGEKIGW